MKSYLLLLTLIISLTGWAQTTQPIHVDEALTALKNGNSRYVDGKRVYQHLDQKRRKETAEKGQFPFATIITCSDSRVPVENVFDAGVGDIFVIRVAGNVVNTDEAGSIEYGVDHLHTPVLVVLGHTGCGAVTAVVKGAELNGNIPRLVDNIIPAVEKAKKEFGDQYTDALLNASIKNNVWQSIEDLLKTSHISAELVKEGKLKIVGAIYHLDNGQVEWLGQHPKQNELITNLN